MAKLEDEGWSIIEVSGSLKVLVVSCWLRMICSGTLSSGTSCSEATHSRTGSEMRTISRLVEEVISWIGSCCWGLSAIASSEAMSEAFSRFDPYSGSSPK